jgi:hypothetical protein
MRNDRIKGDQVKFNRTDKTWSRADGSPIAERYLVVGFEHGLQRWRNGEVIDERFDRPLPDINELNSKVPQKQWEKGMNGPRPPWQDSFLITLFDPLSAETVTYAGSSTGASIAYSNLKEAVTNMRSYLGPSAMPMVTLGWRTFHSKKFGDVSRPHFQVLPDGWFGGNGKAMPLLGKQAPMIEAQPERIDAESPTEEDEEQPAACKALNKLKKQGRNDDLDDDLCDV